MINLDTFTGGVFDTNCFFLLESGILIDAPQGAAAWLAEQGHKVKTLILTHGHIDHVWEAAEIQREHGCRVAYHQDTEPMITEPDFFRKFGYAWDIDSVTPDWLLEETESAVIEGVEFKILLVPGHCPGSLCFLHKAENVLFGGDVLFAGAVGRTDLPGGDWDLLLSGIQTKIFPLGDDVTILPGHGPATKVGIERTTNPYLIEELEG
jgi:hydroxyacylglutathione hydrolase